MPGREVIVVGAGHNGLCCAAYLARAGLKVTVLERRACLGGASVTEELWPGFRVSRAAYVLGLLRPRIVRELELERHGLRWLARTPASFTPLPDGRSLVLGAGLEDDVAEIRRFSTRDAEAYPRFEALLERIARAIEPTLDRPPPTWPLRGLRDLASWGCALRAALRLRGDLPRTARLLLGPARSLLEEWFDSEPLRATLATDAVIGAWASPSSPGTGYVLFHHVMGSITGRRGVWAYTCREGWASWPWL
ncbi:MAG: phytoene desaturase family protein [Myxococcota bacterium]